MGDNTTSRESASRPLAEELETLQQQVRDVAYRTATPVDTVVARLYHLLHSGRRA